MGSVLTFSAGDKFMVRHFLDLGSVSGPQWSNTMEVKAMDGGDLTDLQLFAARCLQVYQAMTDRAVRFARYTISTWEAEGVPYDPEHFYAEVLSNTLGSRALDNPLDLGVCLVLARNAQVGRTGRIWLRGALDETDVELEGGRFKLSDQGEIQGLLDAALTTSNLGLHFVGGAASLRCHMFGSRVVFNVPQYWESPITGLEVHGVSLLPVKHKWYNQSA